jgi:N-glycosylase/DNA lyase
MRTWNRGSIVLPTLSALNVEVTLFGGQAFRWRGGEGGWISGWIGERPVRVRRDGRGLAVRPLDGRVEGLREAASRYFDLDRDYAAIERRLFRDARLRRAAGEVAGIRILRQPGFEALICFIASANNNILRIARIVESLCRLAGEPVETEAGILHRFPEPPALAAIPRARLREEANLGYRDRYVAETARLAASGEADLAAMSGLPAPELQAALMKLPGVGRKVADCVALYGFGRLEAFPVDTWVRRAMAELYLDPGDPGTGSRIVEIARQRFGPYAGLAQQYLFEAFRRGIGP